MNPALRMGVFQEFFSTKQANDVQRVVKEEYDLRHTVYATTNSDTAVEDKSFHRSP